MEALCCDGGRLVERLSRFLAAWGATSAGQGQEGGVGMQVISKARLLDRSAPPERSLQQIAAAMAALAPALRRAQASASDRTNTSEMLRK